MRKRCHVQRLSCGAYREKIMGTYSKSKGREAPKRYVMLEFYMLNSDAWRALSCGGRSAYVEMKKRYNGANNGHIGYGVRDMADALGCADNTAGKYIKELVKKGFLKYRIKGAFNCKKRLASEYIITEYEYNGKLATKDFMRWGLEN